MPRYIQLANWTDQGIRNVKESPSRIRKGIQALEQMGGKLVDISLVMGQYDLVVTYEAPDDETAARFTLALGIQGNARTVTLRAFSLDDFERMTSSL
jgi:uncharacterized protein with GYD domain